MQAVAVNAEEGGGIETPKSFGIRIKLSTGCWSDERRRKLAINAKREPTGSRNLFPGHAETWEDATRLILGCMVWRELKL